MKLLNTRLNYRAIAVDYTSNATLMMHNNARIILDPYYDHKNGVIAYKWNKQT